MKVSVYWITKDRVFIEKIREKFGIPRYTSVNGETSAEISEEQVPLLRECERRGYIQIREKRNKA